MPNKILRWTEPNHRQTIFRLLQRNCKGRSDGVIKQLHCRLVVEGEDGFCFPHWNALLRLYSQGQCPHESFAVFREIRDKGANGDSFTYAFLLKACADAEAADGGMQVHGHTIQLGFESHLYVQTTLVNMYASCSVGCSLYYARQVFDEMSIRSVVTWNALIAGLTKWGEVDAARLLFDEMPERNVVSWTSMIDGYTRRNQLREALLLFRRMLMQCIKPTEITVLTILPAIAGLGALELERQVHASGKKQGFTTDVRVSNALLDAYSKCGSIVDALHVFEEMTEKNLVSYTSMISAFAAHGLAEKALEQFNDMQQKGVKPNDVTFLSVLNACSHGGLLEEGRLFFASMVYGHGIAPGMKHYSCMIDLLGRAGLLEEAEKLILDMPMKANAVVWRTLLGACNVHGNVELGRRVLCRILELEKEYGGDYVLLSNIYSAAGRWDDAWNVRSLLDERRAFKTPGRSFFDEMIS
ncbi:Pentatricopeptide repeat-containing protein [Nymphaea thermarum]|nr:Pentatricopeptide repeat-containing protein [Nymphaea thermarum]